MTASVPLQIGEVGLGGITTVHRAGYRLYDQPVRGGYDPDPAARQRLREERPDAVVYNSLDELLADDQVGLVDLATPHHRAARVDAVRGIAAAGKPLLIQKPLAMSYAEALEVVEIIESAGVTAMVNQNMCFTPAAISLTRTLLADRVVGEPRFARLAAEYSFDTAYHPWFGRDRRWWTVGLTVHHLGLLQLLFGPPATVYSLLGRDISQPGVNFEGYGHLALTYPSGLQVLVLSTGTYYGTRPVPHGNETLWVQGERGLVDWRPEEDVVVSRRTPSGDVDRTTVQRESDGKWFPHAFGLTMAHFRQALAAGRAPLCSVQDNLYVMAVAEATYLSSERNSVVSLQEIMQDRYDPKYGTGWAHGFADWAPPLHQLSAQLS
jgi:predicted dehydrogenase